MNESGVKEDRGDEAKPLIWLGLLVQAVRSAPVGIRDTAKAA